MARTKVAVKLRTTTAEVLRAGSFARNLRRFLYGAIGKSTTGWQVVKLLPVVHTRFPGVSRTLLRLRVIFIFTHSCYFIVFLF